MRPISEAETIIKKETFLLETETVELSQIVGRVLAENVYADMDMPPFDRSQMDGFAVKADEVKNAPTSLRIVGESIAGKGWSRTLSSGEAIRIMTGAPVPKGADSVQKVELTKQHEDLITILQPAKRGQNIVRKAQELKADDTIFLEGEIITDKMVATLASFGYSEILVAKRPKVAILSTGSEIVDVSQKPSKDQIRNSNTWMLRAFAEKYAETRVLPTAADDLEGLKTIIRAAVENCDCLIISGGVSVGDYDFTKPALRQLGATIYFDKISLKPGKPTVFAKLNDTLIFALPGNPVSVAVTFFVFVRMALLEMQNTSQTGLKKGFAKLTHDINGVKGRDSLLPISLSVNRKGRLKIETLRFAGSSNFIRFAKADALVFIPRDNSLKKGEVARISFLP